MGIMRTLFCAAALASSAVTATAIPSSHNRDNGYKLTNEHAKELVNNYNTIWSTGNFSLIPSVVSPDVVYYQDRIPPARVMAVPRIPSTMLLTWSILFLRHERDGRATNSTCYIRSMTGNILQRDGQ